MKNLLVLLAFNICVNFASALLANCVHLVGRSFKYHRPRGIVSAGVEEPNALIDCNITEGEKGTREANNRATFTELRQGLTTKSVNAFPNLNLSLSRAARQKRQQNKPWQESGRKFWVSRFGIVARVSLIWAAIPCWQLGFWHVFAINLT